MINITFKLTNLYLKLVNMTTKRQLFCKKKKKIWPFIKLKVLKKAIYYKYSSFFFLSSIS